MTFDDIELHTIPTPEQYERLLAYVAKRGKDTDGEGCSCKFYRLNETVGLKVYWDKWTRDNSVTNHNNIRQFAPAVGACFRLGDDWVHLVEYVKPVIDANGRPCSRYVFEDDYDKATKEQLEEDKERLMDKLRNNGYEFGDTHWGNFGWRLGTDELIVLDCDGIYHFK